MKEIYNFIQIPKKRQVDRYIKENYITAHVDINWWKNHVNNDILQRYKDIIIGDVLDVGCNHGACTFIASELPNVSTITGIDINSKAFNIGNEAFRENCPTSNKVKFLESKATDIILDNLSIDTIISFHMIEHLYVDDIRLFLLEAHRLLKPEGHLMISIPSENHNGYKDPCHVTFFNQRTLVDFISSMNFNCVETLIETKEPCITALFTKRRKR